MAGELDINFYLMSKMLLVASHSETAEGEIIALLYSSDYGAIVAPPPSPRK